MAVLLIDDDHNDVALFALAVEEADTPIWVHTAFGIREAEAYLEGKGKFADRALHPIPDFMLLDLKMHAGDGFEFLEWRKHSEQFATIPVVVFTGNHYRADIQRALRLGATTHIPKPMSFSELKATVRQVWALGQGSQKPHPSSA